MDGHYITTGSMAGNFFVRELADGTLVWYGESVPDEFGGFSYTHVFRGRRTTANQAVGDLVCVPKGNSRDVFQNVTLSLQNGHIQFGVNNQRFDLMPYEWQLPVTNWDYEERACAYYDVTDSPTVSLTGHWKSNDGGTYYLRQFADNQIFWYGEHPGGAWSNLFFGTLADNRLDGIWVDVPKSGAAGSGQLVLTVDASLLQLNVQSATGGFGGTIWHKSDVVWASVRLTSLQIVRNADVGSAFNSPGDEPYLMPFYVTAGGNQFASIADALNGSTGPYPAVESPIRQNAWAQEGDWPKNNLTWQEELQPQTVLPIPDFISCYKSELRTVNGLDPNAATTGQLAMLAVVLLGFDEGSTRNEDIRAVFNAFLERAPKIIKETLGNAQERLTNEMIEVATQSALSDFWGWLGGFDPDKAMAGNALKFTFNQLRASALQKSPIPFDIVLNGPNGGEWVVSGTICGYMSSSMNEPIREMEVTVKLGYDDLRPNSRLSVRYKNAYSQTPYTLINQPGQKIPGYARQTVRFPVSHPISQSSSGSLYPAGELQFMWERDRGDGLLRQDDSCDFVALRAVGYTLSGQRIILLDNQVINKRLDSNGQFTIPLPLFLFAPPPRIVVRPNGAFHFPV